MTLLGWRRFGESDGRGRTTQKPPGTNQQIHWVFEKGRLVAFDGVADELENPADDKQPERPTPVEKKQRQRNHNQRNADGVRQLVERMLVLGLVVFDEGFRHLLILSVLFIVRSTQYEGHETRACNLPLCCRSAVAKANRQLKALETLSAPPGSK